MIIDFEQKDFENMILSPDLDSDLNAYDNIPQTIREVVQQTCSFIENEHGYDSASTVFVALSSILLVILYKNEGVLPSFTPDRVIQAVRLIGPETINEETIRGLPVCWLQLIGHLTKVVEIKDSAMPVMIGSLMVLHKIFTMYEAEVTKI